MRRVATADELSTTWLGVNGPWIKLDAILSGKRLHPLVQELEFAKPVP